MARSNSMKNIFLIDDNTLIQAALKTIPNEGL